jgi:hypothetical protein
MHRPDAPLAHITACLSSSDLVVQLLLDVHGIVICHSQLHIHLQLVIPLVTDRRTVLLGVDY